MDKAILIIDMPRCCDECFALDDNGDYPFCLITQEQRGYTFRTRELRMDKCPLKKFPRMKFTYVDHDSDAIANYNRGWNDCLDKIKGT